MSTIIAYINNGDYKHFTGFQLVDRNLNVYTAVQYMYVLLFLVVNSDFYGVAHSYSSYIFMCSWYMYMTVTSQ